MNDEFWKVTIPIINWNILCKRYEISGRNERYIPYKLGAKRLIKSNRYSRSQIEDLNNYRKELHKPLFDKIIDLPIRLGDDGCSDLSNHIIGLGYKTYSDVFSNPYLAIGYSNEYIESFSYVFSEAIDILDGKSNICIDPLDSWTFGNISNSMSKMDIDKMESEYIDSIEDLKNEDEGKDTILKDW